MGEPGRARSPRRPPGSRPPGGRPCGVENCGALARNEKPYCLEHMDLVRRADAIMNEVDTRRREVAAVLGAGPDGWRLVNVDGSIAKEIVDVLRLFGAQTMPQLGKVTQLKRDILASYVRALVSSGRLAVNLEHCGRSMTEIVSTV